MIDQVSERITTIVAAGAVASPWWLPSLATLSETAALLLPLAGLAWIMLQIFYKVWKGR